MSKHILVNTVPSANINELVPYTNQALFNEINSSTKLLKSFIIDDVDDVSYMEKTYFQFAKLQEGFVYIATETLFHYPFPQLSEKSFKGITSKRPFVIVSVAGSLSQLKEYGFQTFSNWWDESYDSIQDPSERLSSIIELIEYFCSLSSDQIQKMCIEMTSVLEYNFNYYKNDFLPNELEKFKIDIENL